MMTTQLSSYKCRITGLCYKLDTVLSRFEEEKLETLKVSDSDRTPGYERECQKKIHEGLGAIEACTSKIEQTWQEYGNALSQLNSPPKSESDDYETYSNRADGVLSAALDYTVILEARLRAFKANIGAIQEENYNKAVEFLKEKYGNSEELVSRLIDRLEKITSRSSSIKDQRVLLEQVQVIVSQLQNKGEQVDSHWLLKQVLSKFSVSLQRRVLERKYSMEGSFHMYTLLKNLEDIINSEEQIELYTSKTLTPPLVEPKKERNHKGQFQRVGNTPSYLCMYCGADHKSRACTKYDTPQDRAKYLREHK
ncbi:hypothetical protein OSTOST_00523, partial [Ostertagia ostertagi]